MDVAAPPSALINIWESVSAGARNFSVGSDGVIAFDAPSQDIRIRVDLLEIGNGCIERIHVAEPFFESSVASVSDLLRLRAVTAVDRGSDGEVEDFRWLLLRWRAGIKYSQSLMMRNWSVCAARGSLF